MTPDQEKSFKAKLRAIAKEKNRDPADIWQNLTLERFLVRLARSKYEEHFILKGAVLLSKYINLGRETRDLDFLAQRINNGVDEIKSIFEEIAAINLNDGFLFQDVKVNRLAHPHMGYPGVEVLIGAYFGEIRFKVAIDVGFGDIIKPIRQSLPLTTYSKGNLFESSVELSCYPKEFIFAEKLETVVYRGALNSRMKDFYDLYNLILTSDSQPFLNIEKIIHAVFEHRETPMALPLIYTGSEIAQLQVYWEAYLRQLRAKSSRFLPENISEIIDKINEWIKNNLHFDDKTLSY